LTEYWFYHLKVSPLEAVLPDLLEKTRARGWRTLLRVPQPHLKELDNFLWTFRDDAFLPHGRDDEPLADSHPILLSHTAPDSRGFDCVFCLEGIENLEISPRTTRCIIIIDGRRENSIQSARRDWKHLKEQGAAISYWQQNDRGRWEKRA